MLIPAPLVIKGSTSTSSIGSLLPFCQSPSHDSLPGGKESGGESEDTPAHTVPGVHGEDAADNMTILNWTLFFYPF